VCSNWLCVARRFRLYRADCQRIRRSKLPDKKRSSGRVTIVDIAQKAGVSRGAVSFALNDRPGLSIATRERILSIAKEVGWYPSSAARALQGSRVNACGLVLARPAETLAFEPFFMGLVAGIESELASRSVALTIQVVDDLEAELEVHRRWSGERRVDGVFVVDLRVDDPRPDALVRLGLPAVILSGASGRHPLPTVWQNEAEVVVDAVRYLAALGHRRIARVGGVADFLQTQNRNAAYLATVEKLGLGPIVATTDFRAKSGAHVTRQLLAGPEKPTAFIYESDILAVAGLGVAHEMGFHVPRDLSIIAWDDSPFCQVVHPPLSAVTRDVPRLGARACRRLLEFIEQGQCSDLELPYGQFTPRGSTARAPTTTALDGSRSEPEDRSSYRRPKGTNKLGTSRSSKSSSV
jgi:DNA-binding LacI/PurR family transcriptional regulator